jgi:hypothetical protein
MFCSATDIGVDDERPLLVPAHPAKSAAIKKNVTMLLAEIRISPEPYSLTGAARMG